MTIPSNSIFISNFDDFPFSINNAVRFTGIFDDGTSIKNYNFTPATLINWIISQTRKQITISAVGGGGLTISDSFFNSVTVLKIITDTQCYQKDVDFSQSGGVITGITISFAVGQKIITEA